MRCGFQKNPHHTKPPAVGLFFFLVLGGIAEIVLHPPLHRTGKKKPRYRFDSRVSFVLAERVGFEPTVVLLLRLISSQVHSTTLPPLLCVEACDSSRIFQGANTATPPM